MASTATRIIQRHGGPSSLKLIYSDHYDLNLGNHVFPSIKYRLIKEALLRQGQAKPEDFVEPPMAADDDVALVHDREYIRKLQTGKLSYLEILRMEVPYSPELIRAVWLCAGGSILAGRLAREDGACVNVGGGFHHAFPDHGEGFCVLHDVAIAIRCLQKDRTIERAMTVDCDVHQGNGTAYIFRRDPSVFTLSIHQAQQLSLPETAQQPGYQSGRRRGRRGVPRRAPRGLGQIAR